jgi:glutamine synthetase
MLAKDTSHRTVFPVFTAGGGFGMREMEGAADVLMVADPTDAFACCHGRRHRLAAVRHLFRRRAAGAVRDAQSLSVGARSSKSAATISSPASKSNSTSSSSKTQRCRRRMPASRQPPSVSLLSHGYQYLTEQRYDQMEPVLEIIRRDVLALGLPLRSIEVEFGPSQCEFTLQADGGCARRHHGAVSQRREADLPPPRLSRDLHVPAETAETCSRPAGICINRSCRAKAARTPS